MARIRRHRRDTVQSPLETYLREINEMALLTADEEKELAHRIAAGRQAGARPDGAGQPPAGRQHRPGLHRQGTGASGPDRGGEPRSAPRRSGLRSRRSARGSAPTPATGSSSRSSVPWSIRPSRSASRPTWSSCCSSGGGWPPTCRKRWAGRRPSRRSPRPSKLPKKKLAIVKKAIKVYNLVPQTDQPENGWSLGEMLMDERTRTPDVVMVEADNLRLVLDRLDEMDKREATVLRMRFGLERCAAQDAQGDRRVARPDPRARPPDRERGARQAVGVDAGGLSRGGWSNVRWSPLDSLDLLQWWLEGYRPWISFTACSRDS